MLFNFEDIKPMLEEIEDFIEERKLQIKVPVVDEKSNLDQEYSDHLFDSYLNEQYFIHELEKNLLNGIYFTVVSIIERSICSMVRDIKNKIGDTDFNSRITYKVDDLLSLIGRLNGEDFQFDEELLEKFRIYVYMRNDLIHAGGQARMDEVKEFIESNPELFIIDNEQLYIFRITKEFVLKTMDDYQLFFKTILYDDRGLPIDY
mgnify:FL=1